jgi:Raf kinase inhibitor-like YbhB/YbcL family protein
MQSAKYLVAAAALALSPLVQGFELTSSDIEAGKPMPKAQEYQGFGCDGGNISPQLAWQDIPEGTKSFAVTAYDPDAPTGSGWWHWVVFNIPADVTSLPKGAGSGDGKAMPKGTVQSMTDYGAPGFGGACPPVGDKAHRYIFTLYALDTVLELDATANPALAGYMIKSHALSQASLISYYRR